MHNLSHLKCSNTDSDGDFLYNPNFMRGLFDGAKVQFLLQTAK